MATIRLVRGFLTVGLWTLVSRVLGFARDILIASYLGSGPVAEAFLVAFSLPNLFRRFFAEGAFNMAFIPMFAKKLEGGEDPAGFARDAFSGMTLLLTVFTVLGVAFMPGLVFLMASGFADDARFDLAVGYGRLAFPYILFISLGALASGVLNANGRFAAAAAAPLLLNAIFIVSVVYGGASAPDAAADTVVGETTALALRIGNSLAVSVPIAGVAQLALVWWASRRAGFTLGLRWPRLTPDLKRLAIIAAPAALAGGVVQINLLIGRQVASFFDGAVAWLSYADRLYQLPLGVVGIAIGVVLLPDLSRRLRAGDVDGGQHSLSRAAEFSLALTVPSAVALVVIALPLVSVLFERGRFGADDAAATAVAVAIYGLGLPAFVLQKVLQPLYFAREDTKSPFYFALVAMAVNAGLAIGLSPVFGYVAAAAGTTVAGWVMVWQLWHGARKMGNAAQFDARFQTRVWRIIGAAMIMGAVLWGLAFAMQALLVTSGVRYLALLALVLLGSVSYFLAGGLIGAFKLSDFRSALRRS
jgi:putative peptidoglycan lipid II flippase